MSNITLKEVIENWDNEYYCENYIVTNKIIIDVNHVEWLINEVKSMKCEAISKYGRDYGCIDGEILLQHSWEKCPSCNGTGRKHNIK